jgi:hypothetical protein
MSEIRFMVQLADGSVLHIQGTPTDFARFERLHASGVEGKALIDAIFAEDWRAPPRFVVITLAVRGELPSTTIVPYR